MSIKVQAMGQYQTNCYIITVDNKDFIIDPGVNATSWVLNNTKNPVAILNTHGHFDHVWSNNELQKELNVPLYCPKEDAFMLKDDIFDLNMPESTPNILIEKDSTLNIDGVEVEYYIFSGHTPGCSAIKIDNKLFTGDFIFKGSIGRVDFPYSNPKDMIKSIEKILKWQDDIEIFPGHGSSTTLFNEKVSLKNWINYL